VRWWSLIDLRHVDHREETRLERGEDEKDRDAIWRNAATSKSRLMKATEMRIRIKAGLEQNNESVRQEREAGDILKKKTEGTGVRTCSVGCLWDGHSHGDGLYT
jgi:hypothetical protein